METSIITNNSNDNSKSIVILCYSLTGNTKYLCSNVIAPALQQKLNKKVEIIGSGSAGGNKKVDEMPTEDPSLLDKIKDWWNGL